jgi:DNA-binding CsgD family transcriptional regulator
LAAALFAGRLARGASAFEVAQAGRGAPASPQPPQPSDLLLRGLALLITDGPSVGTPVLKRAVAAFRDEDLATEEGMRWLWLAGGAAGRIWDYEDWDALTARQIQLARDLGALTTLPLALGTRAVALIFAGELRAAASHVEESEAIVGATHGRINPYAPVVLAAFRGREDDFERLIQTSTKDFMASGEGLGLTMAQWATAVLSNGLARYEDALGAAGQAAEYPHELWFSTWVAVELIEAASRTGEVDRTADAIERLSRSARAGGSDWGLGVEARSRALLSDGDVAEGLYREAIERLQRTRLRVDLARAHLVYGEWLRRERRRLDAREQLRTALEMFRRMDVEGFAGRAERELSATGERARKRTVETREELTAQEAQIARLARDGLSNSAIGERLFISQHTVAYHLRKVFTKLDITSRNQLGRVLPPSSDLAGLA